MTKFFANSNSSSGSANKSEAGQGNNFLTKVNGFFHQAKNAVGNLFFPSKGLFAVTEEKLLEETLYKSKKNLLSEVIEKKKADILNTLAGKPLTCATQAGKTPCHDNDKNGAAPSAMATPVAQQSSMLTLVH